MIDLCGTLSEEHVAGKAGEAGEEGGAVWQDIAIWTDSQFKFLAGKALNSMRKSVIRLKVRFSGTDYAGLDVPVGGNKAGILLDLLKREMA